MPRPATSSKYLKHMFHGKIKKSLFLLSFLKNNNNTLSGACLGPSTLISLEVCKTVYHCKIQVKFDIGNRLQNFGRVVALFST